MKMITKNQSKISTITLLVLLTVSAFAVSLTTVSAQSTGKAYPFIDAVPDEVGVNQATLLNTGALNYLNTAADGWNVSIQITKPDGSVETLGPFKTFSTGTWGQTYIPDQIGTYKIKTIFPEQVYNDVTYPACESDEIELVVDEDPVETYPGNSLPDEYWYRPINSQLREWAAIAGSWETKPDNLYAPCNDGPETSHILWQIPLGDSQGGLTGGNTGNHGMDDGDAYEGKFASSLILNGILYYNKQANYFFGGAPNQTVVAVDIHSGEVLWEKAFDYGDGRVDYGQILYWDSINNRGAHAYLWFTSGTTWYAVEAYTGDYRYTMTNVPSGTIYRGDNGELYIYSVTNLGNTTDPDWRLLRWSSVETVVGAGGYGFWAESWAYNVQGATYNASNGYDMNVSISGIASGSTLLGSVQKVFVGEKVIGAQVTSTDVTLWAVSLEEGSEGTLLYNTVWDAPAEWAEGNITISSIGQAGWCAWSQEDQVGVFFTKENVVHYGFDLETGEFLYETEPQIFIDAWSDTVTSYGPDRIIVYGKLISATVGGIVYCYDARTGELEWTYEADDPYGESYIGNNWWICPVIATDGKVYFGSLEHSALDPKPRGAPFFALDMEGNVVFRADGLFRQTRWGGRAMIGDSIIVTQDTYDQQILGIGKGPSEITVSVPETTTVGSFTLLSGALTDVSPGTLTTEMATRFPNGVPAVGDESMDDWMLYVYKQFAKPEEVTGLTVYLSVVTPSGETINLGSATTNIDGKYAYNYIPQEEGIYEVTATFEGSGAYYGAESTTYMLVGPAASASTPIEPEEPTTEEPTTPEEPTTEEPTTEEPTTEEPTTEEPEPEPTETPLITTEVAIVLAVVAACIIGAVAYIALRRK